MAQPAAPKAIRSIAATLTAALMLGACAQGGEGLQSSLLDPAPAETASPPPMKKVAQTELEKATEYWGKKFQEKPTDLEAALSFARNLKAMGERQQALNVIQQASVYHGNDRALASEYGRLALELDQVSLAKQLLAVADDPSSPDWRVISARGTVAAKEGKSRDAIGLYERALTLSQDQSSVMNNLAMAYAMNGEAAKAEDMLRRIEAKGGATAKTRQNLALVLGLQGKFDEAKTAATKDLGADGAAQDTDYLKRMVKVEKAADWNTTSTTSKLAQATAKAAATPEAIPTAMPAVADPEPLVASQASVSSGNSVLKGMTR